MNTNTPSHTNTLDPQDKFQPRAKTVDAKGWGNFSGPTDQLTKQTMELLDKSEKYYQNVWKNVNKMSERNVGNMSDTIIKMSEKNVIKCLKNISKLSKKMSIKCRKEMVTCQKK